MKDQVNSLMFFEHLLCWPWSMQTQCLLLWLSCLWQSFWRCWENCQAGFRDTWVKVLKGICWRFVFCSRDILPASPELKAPSCVYFWTEEEARREVSSSGIFIAMESGEGKVCVSQETLNLCARVQEKHKSSLSCGLFFTRQTFNMLPSCCWWINWENYKR